MYKRKISKHIRLSTIKYLYFIIFDDRIINIIVPLIKYYFVICGGYIEFRVPIVMITKI